MRFVLGLCALLTATPAAAEWREAETAHFRIVSGGDEKDLVKFAERLENFHTLLRLATGANEAAHRTVKVRVFLVPGISDVVRLYGRGGADIAGFYSPRDDGAIAVVPRSTGDGTFTGQLVLFHEYAHHYMLQYTPAAYPSWYVEGFAEIASTASFERKGSITFGKAATHRQYELDSIRYPTAGMIDGSYLKDREKGRGWSYGDAWLVSHYLTFADARRGQLRAYLNAVNAGKPLSEAASAFGDLSDLQRETSVYLSGGSFPFRAVPIPPGPQVVVKLRSLDAAEAALIEETIELAEVVDLPDKPDQVEAEEKTTKKQDDFATWLAKATQRRDAWITKLEATAARFPDRAAGWLLLADATCIADMHQRCRDAAARALAAAPSNGRALTRKAEAEIALARDLPDAERVAAVEAAQASLLKVNAADPDDPLPLLAFYRSFAAIDRGADADGLDALLSAVQLVPQRPGPRLTLAGEFIARGRLRDARIILRPLAYSPHETGASRQARAMLEQIDAAQGESG